MRPLLLRLGVGGLTLLLRWMSRVLRRSSVLRVFTCLHRHRGSWTTLLRWRKRRDYLGTSQHPAFCGRHDSSGIFAFGGHTLSATTSPGLLSSKRPSSGDHWHSQRTKKSLSAPLEGSPSVT